MMMMTHLAELHQRIKTRENDYSDRLLFAENKTADYKCQDKQNRH